MSRVYFTADWHLFHNNILTYCKRPFVDTEEMQTAFLSNYNDKVTESDTVWILGDLMMAGRRYKRELDIFIDKLNGTKHLVTGNHDRLSNRQYIDVGFSSVHTYFPFYFNSDSDKIPLMHDPSTSVAFPDCDCFTAHVHGLWRRQIMDNGSRCVNVGVDVWDYSPVSFDKLLEEIND